MTNFGKGSERIRVQQGMRPVAEALKKRTGGKWQEWQLQISKHMNDQQMLVGSLTWCSCSDKGPMRDQPSGAMAQTSLLHHLKGNENLRLKGNTAEIHPSILLQVFVYGKQRKKATGVEFMISHCCIVSELVWQHLPLGRCAGKGTLPSSLPELN